MHDVGSLWKRRGRGPNLEKDRVGMEEEVEKRPHGAGEIGERPSGAAYRESNSRMHSIRDK